MLELGEIQSKPDRIRMPHSDDERWSGLNGRRRAVLRIVRERGFASIASLAEEFGVSQQTIRRDIIELARRNLVQRYHGGAGLPTGHDRLAYANRRVRRAEAKRRIAEAVARAIPDGSSLFIDIGTTTEAVARALLKHRRLRVITNHVGVVWLFCQHTDFEIVLAGGMVRNRDLAIIGTMTAAYLADFRVAYGIFGVGAIDPDGNLLDYDYRDMRTSRAAMEIARRRFVVADSSKFAGDAMIRLGHLDEIDALFTDAPPPPEIRARLEESATRLVLAQEPEAASQSREGPTTRLVVDS